MWSVERVSIHAPARGATRRDNPGFYRIVVSIHAPARGATCPSLLTVAALLFQSTRPRGARRVLTSILSSFASVSIHAPARGATSTGKPLKRNMSFQSTRPRGARHAARKASELLTEFQSTRPRGARLGIQRPNPAIVCFNPRARAGRDTGGN